MLQAARIAEIDGDERGWWNRFIDIFICPHERLLEGRTARGCSACLNDSINYQEATLNNVEHNFIRKEKYLHPCSIRRGYVGASWHLQKKIHKTSITSFDYKHNRAHRSQYSNHAKLVCPSR